MSNQNNKLFLYENTLSSYNKEYLLENQGGIEQIKKWMENPDLPIYLYGLIQKGDTPNRNGRIYPWGILKKECDRYLNEEIRDGQSYGELDHPLDSPVPELKNAAMTLEDIWYKNNEVYGKVKILNAFMPQSAPGLIARGIILNEKKIGISSRALGSVYEDGSGYVIVSDDLEMICWDLVSRPSTVGANLYQLQLNKMVKESKMLTESINNKDFRKIKKEIARTNLTSEQKIYLDILGVEKFLQMNIIK